MVNFNAFLIEFSNGFFNSTTARCHTYNEYICFVVFSIVQEWFIVISYSFNLRNRLSVCATCIVGASAGFHLLHYALNLWKGKDHFSCLAVYVNAIFSQFKAFEVVRLYQFRKIQFLHHFTAINRYTIQIEGRTDCLFKPCCKSGIK